MPHARECVQFLDARALLGTVAVGNGYGHALRERAAVYASYGYAACIGGVVEGRDEHLRRALELLGRGDVLKYLVEQMNGALPKPVELLPDRAYATAIADILLNDGSHKYFFNAHKSNAIYTDNGLILPKSISKQSYIIYK